jgi:hypothetical protein
MLISSDTQNILIIASFQTNEFFNLMRKQFIVGLPAFKLNFCKLLPYYIILVCSLFNDAFSVTKTLQRRMKG